MSQQASAKKRRKPGRKAGSRGFHGEQGNIESGTRRLLFFAKKDSAIFRDGQNRPSSRPSAGSGHPEKGGTYAIFFLRGVIFGVPIHVPLAFLVKIREMLGVRFAICGD